jgi:hypothetical protein
MLFKNAHPCSQTNAQWRQLKAFFVIASELKFAWLLSKALYRSGLLRPATLTLAVPRNDDSSRFLIENLAF